MNRKLYIIFLLLLPFFALAGVLGRKYIPLFMENAMPCVLYSLTGFCCPGCGGTRAVVSLLDGHFLESFWYHPVVIYTAVLVAWYYVSNTVEFLTKGRIHIGLHFKVRHLWTALVIILLQCAVKNLLLAAGIPYPVDL